MKMNHLLIGALLATTTFSAYAKKEVKAVKAEAVKSNAGKYSVDVAHSKVGFEVAHLVIATVEGRFNGFSGEIELADKITDSKVSATVNIDSISTENGDRDKHLKSADFFDAGKYPTMKFVSKKITGTDKNLKITGDLTIKDKTLEMTFDGKFNGVVVDPWGNTKAGFAASTKINRQKFGLTWSNSTKTGEAVVGDEVTISLKIEGVKVVEKAEEVKK